MKTTIELLQQYLSSVEKRDDIIVEHYYYETDIHTKNKSLYVRYSFPYTHKDITYPLIKTIQLDILDYITFLFNLKK